MSRVSHFCGGSLFSHCCTVTLLECKNVISPWKLKMFKIKTQNRNASTSAVVLITNREVIGGSYKVLDVTSNRK